MFMCLCFVAKQDEGVAGTLHVVVAEGNCCSTWRAFSQLFYVIPLLLTVYVVLKGTLSRCSARANLTASFIGKQ